ncbi:C40 family peptidase [Bacillus sp. OAE603]|uniref:C40 family peptidase n=1 Tax=Gottfriedia sp. OAE603 TaxID=2663872 RepID=UPI00178C139B
MKKGFILLSVIFLFLVGQPLSKTSAATMDGNDIVNEAKQHIGVDYVYGGTTPNGFDCSGFTRYVYKEAVGISLPRSSSDQYEVGKSVSKDDLEPGDLVFFSNTYKSGISHAGIYVGNNKFISASSSKGIKIDSLSGGYWGPKYTGAKRIIK